MNYIIKYHDTIVIILIMILILDTKILLYQVLSNNKSVNFIKIPVNGVNELCNEENISNILMKSLDPFSFRGFCFRLSLVIVIDANRSALALAEQLDSGIPCVSHCPVHLIFPNGYDTSVLLELKQNLVPYLFTGQFSDLMRA